MDERYERGLDVYASQFHIPREQVVAWFAERVSERVAREAILSAAGAWVDDELSLRDRSLVVVAALITQGAPSSSSAPTPAGRSNTAARPHSSRRSAPSSASTPATRASRAG